MSLRGAIYDLLNDVEADVYPLVVPQETTDPYVAYSMRTEPVRDQSGMHLTEVSLTLNIFANTFAGCVTLANSLFSGLESKSGTYDGEDLFVCVWQSESDDYIPDLEKFNITQEYLLKFT